MALESVLLFKESAKKSFLILRWLLIIICSTMIVLSRNLLIDLTLAHLVVLLLIISNLLLHSLPERYLSRSFVYSCVGLIDVLLVTMALVISGQTDTDFYMVYFLIIIIAVLSQNLSRILISTFLIIVLYGIILFATTDQKTVFDSSVLLRLPFFLIIALVYAHLVQKLRGERTEKQEAAGLYEKSKSQAEMQKILKELNQDITTLDVYSLLRTLTEKVREILRVDICDASFVEGSAVNIMAVSGVHRGFLGSGVLGTHGGRMKKIIETRRPFAEFDASKGASGFRSEATRYPGVRGYLGVPFLSREGKAIGVIRALTYEPRDFTGEEVELLQQIANGAAIALENARLLEDLRSTNLELERSSREQRALREFLSNILLLNLEQILQRLTDQAAALFEADIAWIRVFDEQGQIKTGAVAGNQAVVKQIMRGQESQLIGRGRWMLDHGKPLAINDMAQDLDRPYRSGVKAADLHGFLGAPLLSRAQKPLGLIYVMTRLPRDFTLREIDLIGQFANGAAIAIENARLLQELKGKSQALESTNVRLTHLLEEQSALREIFAQINLLDLNQLLANLANRALKFLRVDHIQIRLLNKDRVLQTVALAGKGSERFRDQVLKSGKGRSTWIMQNRRPMAIRDIGQDMYFGPGSLMHDMGVKAYLGVPMISRAQQSIGVLLVTSLEERSFTEEEITIAQQFAAGAAIAIENTQLFEEVQNKSKELEEAYQTKSSFLNTMAHELRTPLNVILGTYQLLVEGYHGDLSEDQRQALERIERNANDLLRLIDEILGLVRLEAKRVPLKIEEFSLNELADELESSFHPLARKKGLELKFNVENSLPMVKSDPSKIKEIMQNLIANAVKYTDQGQVEIRAFCTNTDSDPERKRVSVAVRDTGIGMKESHLQHLFEPFYMAEGVDRSKYPGSGLGLSIVKRLVELLEGDIRVQSESGKGSVFTVDLPVSHSSAID